MIHSIYARFNFSGNRRTNETHVIISSQTRREVKKDIYGPVLERYYLPGAIKTLNCLSLYRGFSNVHDLNLFLRCNDQYSWAAGSIEVSG